ncbi:hypothetical protein QQG55_9960 [Brugia pahangi]
MTSLSPTKMTRMWTVVDLLIPSHLKWVDTRDRPAVLFARILEINSSNLCHTVLWTTLVPAIKWYHKIHVKYERLVAEMSSPWLPYLIQLVAMTPLPCLYKHDNLGRVALRNGHV